MCGGSRMWVACVLVCVSMSVHAQRAELFAHIDANSEAGWTAAQQIWAWAEPGYEETKSSALLMGLLAEAGFEIESGVAGIPTAFTATYGSGEPVIGILGEFDALPGLSQQASTERGPLSADAWGGHGCGHHLFGVGSAMASIALSKQIASGAMPGTIRFYGTPAEEGGSAKTFMSREGLFEDCGAVLHWHPGDKNAAGDPTNMARIAVKFEFRGKSAHAAAAPELGRSALDAVALTNYAAEMMREHTPDFTRIHHVITAGGRAPNVVPDFAEVYYYVRHPDATVVRGLYARLLKCAEAGALATETALTVKFQGGTHNMLPNDTLSAVTLRNLRELADLGYDEVEREFANKMRAHLDAPASLESIGDVLDARGEITKGSTDVGDVSWVTPTTGFRTACWVPGTPAHSWMATAAGGTTLGRDGMLLAARVLAATAWDLAHDEALLAAAQAELEKRLASAEYAPLLEPGQAPPLGYRDAP